MGWDRQTNMDGDTLADWAAKSLDRIADAIEEIAKLYAYQLKVKIQWGDIKPIEEEN